MSEQVRPSDGIAPAITTDEVGMVSASFGLVAEVEAGTDGLVSLEVSKSELDVANQLLPTDASDPLPRALVKASLPRRGAEPRTIDWNVDSEAGLAEVDGQVLFASLSADANQGRRTDRAQRCTEVASIRIPVVADPPAAMLLLSFDAVGVDLVADLLR